MIKYASEHEIYLQKQIIIEKKVGNKEQNTSEKNISLYVKMLKDDYLSKFIVAKLTICLKVESTT